MENLQEYARQTTQGAVQEIRNKAASSGIAISSPPHLTTTVASATEADAKKTARVVVYVYMAIKLLIVLRTVACMLVFRGGTPEQRWIKFLLAVTTGPVSALYNPPSFCSRAKEVTVKEM